MPEPLTILVRYHDPDLGKLSVAVNGDWVDLRCADTVRLDAGQFAILPLGISMRLPDGYEAHIAPRSSTFKRWGILQTNGVGVIDNSYSGDNDIWGMPVYATRETTICKGDRVCQFRIMRRMKPVHFEEVAHLDGDDRGGFGSTGIS